jgi:hypothetical protein
MIDLRTGGLVENAFHLHTQRFTPPLVRMFLCLCAQDVGVLIEEPFDLLPMWAYVETVDRVAAGSPPPQPPPKDTPEGPLPVGADANKNNVKESIKRDTYP